MMDLIVAGVVVWAVYRLRCPAHQTTRAPDWNVSMATLRCISNEGHRFDALMAYYVEHKRWG